MIIKIEPVDNPRLITEIVEVKVHVVATDKNAAELHDLSWQIPENIRGTRFPSSAETDATDAGQTRTPQQPAGALATSGTSNKTNSKSSWAEGWNLDQTPADVPADITVAPYDYTFRIPAARIDWSSLLRFWRSDSRVIQSSLRVLFYTGGRSKIVIVAHAAKDARSSAQPYHGETPIEIEFLPSPTALVLGGILGVVLLALFERLVSLSTRLTEGRWPKKASGGLDWGQVWRSGRFWLSTQFLTGTVQLLLGACAVIIFLLCVGLWQDRDLPINFKVNGFIAAVFVGLSTHLVVAKLYVRFVEPKVRAREKGSSNRESTSGQHDTA